MRSVFFTLFLLLAITYVFAIAFTQQLRDSEDIWEDGDEALVIRFKVINVLTSAETLLFNGVIPDESHVVRILSPAGLGYQLLMICYILLASLTVMNMLVGVLCEVVSVVSSVEKESLALNYVKSQLQQMLTA